MGKVIAIANRKGGVGKTTTAIALGAGLTKKGYKVLFIDLDPQRNLTYSIGANAEAPTTIANVLFRGCEATDGIQHTTAGDIIPASKALATADLIMTNTGREYALKKALKDIKGAYNYIIIDTPPALGTLTINALTVADKVIIPTRHDMYGIIAIADLTETIESVREFTNPNLTIDGILLTQKKARATLANDILEALNSIATKLKTKVYKVAIRDTIALMEAGGMKETIFSHAPKGNGATDYDVFIEEFLKGDK